MRPLIVAALATLATIVAASKSSGDVSRCKGILGNVWEVEEFCSDWLHVKTNGFSGVAFRSLIYNLVLNENGTVQVSDIA
jgi:hypothetical protein